MDSLTNTRLILVRHALPLNEGRLCGRSDIPADCGEVPSDHNIIKRWGRVDRIVTSPARRCRQTLEALWPDAAVRPEVEEESLLWEQDFGDWEGVRLDSLPDLGPLEGPALADFRPPNGESFDELCERVQTVLASLALERAGQSLLVCTHAGPIRAALGLALGLPPAKALRFHISTLSVTVMNYLNPELWSIDQVNGRLER